jgi:hypothetical protein
MFKTKSLVDPYFTVRMPLALFATMPPMVDSAWDPAEKSPCRGEVLVPLARSDARLDTDLKSSS